MRSGVPSAPLTTRWSSHTFSASVLPMGPPFLRKSSVPNVGDSIWLVYFAPQMVLWQLCAALRPTDARVASSTTVSITGTGGGTTGAPLGVRMLHVIPLTAELNLERVHCG